eukprot:359749-Chlamydomonas_euryale.AAC.2
MLRGNLPKLPGWTTGKLECWLHVADAGQKLGAVGAFWAARACFFMARHMEAGMSHGAMVTYTHAPHRYSPVRFGFENCFRPLCLPFLSAPGGR